MINGLKFLPVHHHLRRLLNSSRHDTYHLGCKPRCMPICHGCMKPRWGQHPECILGGMTHCTPLCQGCHWQRWRRTCMLLLLCSWAAGCSWSLHNKRSRQQAAAALVLNQACVCATVCSRAQQSAPSASAVHQQAFWSWKQPNSPTVGSESLDDKHILPDTMCLY